MFCWGSSCVGLGWQLATTTPFQETASLSWGPGLYLPSSHVCPCVLHCRGHCATGLLGDGARRWLSRGRSPHSLPCTAPAPLTPPPPPQLPHALRAPERGPAPGAFPSPATGALTGREPPRHPRGRAQAGRRPLAPVPPGAAPVPPPAPPRLLPLPCSAHPRSCVPPTAPGLPACGTCPRLLRCPPAARCPEGPRSRPALTVTARARSGHAALLRGPGALGACGNAAAKATCL